MTFPPNIPKNLSASDAPKVESINDALEIERSLLSISAAYSIALSEVVFSKKTEIESEKRKNYISHAKLLSSQDAYLILSIIWKETLLTEEELNMFDNRKKYFNRLEISQHGLAVSLSSSPEVVSALYSSIRNICVSAEYFNLIVRRAESRTKILLMGAPLLNDLMINMANQYNYIYSKEVNFENSHRDYLYARLYFSRARIYFGRKNYVP